jgi:transcriptional regulator with XRE-family HTH domain
MDEYAQKVSDVVGRRVRRLRREQDLSQETLAFLASVHSTQISLFESRTRLPRVDTLIKLAGSLGVPTAALIGDITWEASLVRPGRFVFPPPERSRRVPGIPVEGDHAAEET